MHATDPVAYTTVTRNHKPCLRCVDCGREGQGDARIVTHARNCDLTGLPRDKMAGPLTTQQAKAAAEITRLRSMAAAVKRGESGLLDERDVQNLVSAGLVSMSAAMDSDF